MNLRNCLSASIVLVMFLPFAVFGQVPSEEWVKRYSNGSAVDLAVDSAESGNIGAAENKFGAMLNKIQAASRSGRIDSETAATLTIYVNSLIANISNQQ